MKQFLPLLIILSLACCTRGSEPSGDVKKTSAAVSESEPKAVEPDPKTVPDPEPDPEPETVDVFDGTCYAGGMVLWRGMATDINGGDPATFKDASGRSISILGPNTCIWRFELTRKK